MANLIPFRRTMGVQVPELFPSFSGMLDDFLTDMPAAGVFRTDIIEKENEYELRAELPGVKKENISLSYTEDALHISVSSTEEKAAEKENYIRKERRFGSMKRSIAFPDIQAGAITARLEEGILTVTLPKDMEKKASRDINIA